ETFIRSVRRGDLVQDDRTDLVGKADLVRSAGRSADESTGIPVLRNLDVEKRIRELERGSRAVRTPGPRSALLPMEACSVLAVVADESEDLARVVEAPRPRAEHGLGRADRSQGVRVRGDDEIALRRHRRPGRKDVLDAADEHPAAEIDGRAAAVVELDELL